ncbi:MAG TPA: hypothetical protein VE570_14460 [Thermoleophilaceae bacterium]|jgi:hypothetical protein|nr:hypothetical protein [Thermoleophilaceae bacterium]
MTSLVDEITRTPEPVRFMHEHEDAVRLPRSELEALQLAGLRERFERLRERVAVLGVLADEQRITAIDRLHDAAPLLFQHTMYKSYPAKLLLRHRFADLTRWLQRLTAVDLSGVPVEGLTSIDGWLDALEAHTSLRVLTSSGTTGTMSFLPKSTMELEVRDLLTELPEGEHRDVVWPNFRHGSSAWGRMADIVERRIAGGPERFHALHPGRMSADLQLFAARLKLAQARGERLDVDESLLARRAEFETQQREMRDAVPRFLAELDSQVRDKSVFMLGVTNVTLELAQAGIAAGIEGLFARESRVMIGGGAKGVVLPPDFEQIIARFTGVPAVENVYGMSEVNAANRRCVQGRYHIAPTTVLYMLDPDDGHVLARKGSYTARAAFYDLLAQTYWGGFVSGDEVTVDWSQCACGQTTPHLAPTIQRYSEKRGGDDKITCAATEGAQQSALNFLTGELG